MPIECMDNVNLGNCLWFEGGSERRNVVSGMISGLLFSVGWWLIIDAMAVNPSQVPGTYLICGLVGTFSLFILTVMSVDLGSEWMKVAIASPDIPEEIAHYQRTKWKTLSAIAFRYGECTSEKDALTVGVRFPSNC